MDIATLVFTVIGALSSAVTVYFSSIRYLGREDALKELSKNLESIKVVTSADGSETLDLNNEPDLKRHKEHILGLMRSGRYILHGFKRKLAARFIVLFAASFGFSGFMYWNGPGQVADFAVRTEWWDIGIFGFVNLLPWAALALDRIIMPHEWRFVRALLVLEDAYYRVFVEPKMISFYKEVKEFFERYCHFFDLETELILVKESNVDLSRLNRFFERVGRRLQGKK
jgi:hypothetical protein